MKTYAVILAAGKGTRMKSELPKVLHCVGGIPMVGHLVNKLEKMKIDEIIVVVGHLGHLIKEYLGNRVTYVEQAEQRGTAHAVRQAETLLKGRDGITFVLTGDTPLIKEETLRKLLEWQKVRAGAGVVLTAQQPDPAGYGRILRNQSTQEVSGIVEEKDATDQQKNIKEVNTGIFCFDNRILFQVIPSITNNNAQNEFYLTDIIGVAQLKKFAALMLEDPQEVIGINTREQLQEAEKIFSQKFGTMV
jgi:bifunctional UDP-N-acetylglucosamine pyrophosphorylase / glucosamine-1-phosphate N-acetyltransferase